MYPDPFEFASVRRRRFQSPQTKLFENVLWSGSSCKRCFHVVVRTGKNGAFRKRSRDSVDLLQFRPQSEFVD